MADIRGASNNIYTVLAMIAALTLLIGVAYVTYRYMQVFGGTPFFGNQTASLMPVLPFA